MIELRPGLHEVSLERDTPGVTLIDSLRFGPELVPATPVGDGMVVYQIFTVVRHDSEHIGRLGQDL